MSGLNEVEARRLAVFLQRLLAPPPGQAHEGIARALLGSRYRWQPADRAFLRLQVCRPSASSADYERLRALAALAREHSV